MEFIFILTPFIAWLVAGVTKFIINYIRYNRKAFSLIGNGGFPSTHTTVVTSTTMLIGFYKGFNTPIFGLAVTVLYIIIIDALGIRKAVGKHAQVLNKYVVINTKEEILRERQGHNHMEVFGGLVLGIFLAYVIYKMNC